MIGRSRVLFASILGTIWISVFDGFARVFSDKTLEVSFSGAAVSLGTALFVGALLGAVLWALVESASVNGPARSITIEAVERLSRAPWWAAAAAAIAFAVPPAAAIPIRAKLLAKSGGLAAAIDVAALAAGWALVLAALRLFGEREGRRISRHAAGWGCLAAAAAAALAFVKARPALTAGDVWILVLLGDLAIFILGASLLMPEAVLKRGVVLGVAAAAILGGVASSAALERSESVREETAEDWSPTSWFVSAATSIVDFDGDGFSPIFGGGDCDDRDEFVNPEGIEIAGNGIDENCRDGDKEAKLPWPERPTFVSLPDGAREPRSILLIVVDAMRGDRLGVYGYPRPTSPRIDELASGGIVFDHAYSSAPTTRIAIPMLFAGRFLSDIPWNRQVFPYGMQDKVDTLAEILKKERGLNSIAYVTHRFMDKKRGWLQGFDELNDDFVLPRSEYENVATGAALSAKVAGWLESHRDERFFVYAHFLDTHSKYLKHEEGPDFGDGLSDRYDSEVWYSDRSIGVLLDKLKELGLYDDTLIIVMSDHGEYLGEHGKNGHGGSMYEPGVQIPLIVHAPGFTPNTSDCVVGHVDLAPTVLNLFGIDGGKYGMSGASLVPDMLRSGCASDREVILEVRFGRLGAPNYRALIGKRWKLVADVRRGRYQLFDLENDPEENRNVATMYPKEYQAIKNRLLAWTDVYANREQLQIMRELVSDEPPPTAERTLATFENGIDLVAVDLGKRSLVGNEEPTYQLYFRARERERRRCEVHFFLVDEKGDTRFDTKHPPVAGTFPFARWPLNKVVNDGFALELFNSLTIGGKLKDGRYGARVGISCGKDAVRARTGEVDSEGRADVGFIHLERRSKRVKQDDE